MYYYPTIRKLEKIVGQVNYCALEKRFQIKNIEREKNIFLNKK